MRLLLILLTILITSCSTTELVNVHKPLELSRAQCDPRASSELRRRILTKREGETGELFELRLKDIVELSKFYKAKITTLCNIAAEHDKAHSQ